MKKKIIFINLLLVFIFTLSMIAFAEVLDNDVKVETNTDLTYYLNIDYDGVDEQARVSSDNATVNVQSDIIEVTDKLPLGLTYKGIVETETGTIGAVTRDTGSPCVGYVIDGTDGINYDNQTHTVSFKVKNLGAGCRLTVGVIVTTPASVNGRVDFYNTFSAFENNLSKISNQVHVYMGDDNATLYKVKYQYTGNVPEDAPVLPDVTEYASGTSINVLNDVSLLGYEFSGWETDDVSVSNSSFTMPEGDVTFEGSFTPKTKYKVEYEIEGDMPEGYIVPSTESYYELANVEMDNLKEDDIVNGYKFLGWKTTDVEVNDNLFIMPNKNVKIKGKFERISYTVTYSFQGSVIPNNSSSLLPEAKKYYPGDKVTLESPKETKGYEFLGWYKNDKFTMPSEDVIIYGEWMESKGLFEPQITKEIINPKDEYKLDEEVKFKIVVTNTADYDIKNVMVRENNDLATFVQSEDYILSSDHVVTIPVLKSKESVVISAKYVVTEKSLKHEKNEVEIVGAVADDNYHLNTNKEYKASVEFITNNQKDVGVPNTFKNITYKGLMIGIPLIIIGLFVYIINFHKFKKQK